VPATTDFRPGFRISALGCAVLLIGAVGSILAAGVEGSLGIAVAFTVGHFFLFCNVIRMARPYELIWAAIFVALAASTLLLQSPVWNPTFVLSSIATCILVTVQMRHPSYHGIFWNRINPGLREWWQQRHQPSS
jgi:hypothetical protein